MATIKKIGKGPYNPQKASAYVGKGVLRKGGNITPVPDGPLIKKKGEFKGSTLKKGGKVKKAQVGEFLKKLGPKPDSASSKVMTKDEIKKRTVPDKVRVPTPGIITGFKTPTTDAIKTPSSKKGGKIKKARTGAWQRKEGKNPEGGLNAKGVASYRRENPGSKLKMAVTTPPSKLKPGSKSAKRRKSFCARMSGVKGPMKKPNGKPTRKALALRKWNC